MILHTHKMNMCFVLRLQRFEEEVLGVKNLGEDGEVMTTRECAELTNRIGFLKRVPGRFEQC
jgi:hypothetical protein